MEYSTRIFEGFKKKVSLVVIAIDDFTGKPILGSNVRVYIDGAAAAIKKKEGYHVFVNLDRRSFTVRADGGLYNSRSMECDLTASEEQYTLLKIRMFPNRSYPIPQNTTCIEGKAAPASRIRVFGCDSAGAYKLLYDYKQDTKNENKAIYIFHPDDIDLEGKLLHITDSEGKNQEFLRITGVADQENRMYLMEKGLAGSYKKIGTSLFSVYETTADKNGDFFLPIANTHKEKNLYVCETTTERTVSLKFELDSGRVNKIDLR